MQFHSFDEQYLSQLAAGDFKTQQHFVAYFSELINLRLHQRLGSRQEVDDARQETFTRVFAMLRKGGLRQPERLGAFVNSICNNVLLEHYRAALGAPAEEVGESEIPDPTDPGAGPEAALAARQMTQQIREVIQELPERDRRLIREIFLEERDKDEVCRDLGVDREHLRILLHRVKKSFKSLYAKRMAAQVSTLKHHVVD
jgi:RNA polymerase sigma-70 factor (ECF subfamily)